MKFKQIIEKKAFDFIIHVIYLNTWFVQKFFVRNKFICLLPSSGDYRFKKSKT
jgi:hypothetical protein